MEINLNILNNYYEDGLLYKQVHPELPLTIWNYSEKVQFEDLWDEVLIQCRGLVTDAEGNIIGKCLPKFFNIEEGKHTPTSEFDVFEKEDGSLGVLFNYKGEWVIATRGSFTSDQAIKAKEIIDSKYDLSTLNKTYTYLFEIIYKSNRIVVDYGDMEELILLTAIKTETGEEIIDYDAITAIGETIGCPVVKKYDGIEDYEALKAMVKDDAEGFIVRFSNGSRMKVKGSEYIRLHRIMTNVSTTSIWDVLRSDGNLTELIKDVPDEFYDKITNYAYELELNFQAIKARAYGMYYEIMEAELGWDVDQKTFALRVKGEEYASLLFLIRRGGDEMSKRKINTIIWKMIKPEYERL